MKQKVSRNKAILYMIVLLAVIVLAALWPLGLIRHRVVAKSDEVMARESDPISVEYNLTQMFDGIEGRLDSVDLYVCNDMAGQTMTFRLYDGEHRQVYEQFYNVDPDFIAPDFVHIPIRFDLTGDSEYSFIVEGLTQDLYLAYEDRATTTSPVNFYMAYGGAEVPEYDVIVRYNVACRFVWWQVLLMAVGAAAVCLGLGYLLLRKTADKEILLKRLLQWTVNPVLVIVGAIIVYITLGVRLFGPDTKNNLFITMGLLMLLAIAAYAVNFTDIRIDIKGIKGIDFRKVLRVISIATVLWYCYEYMNGLYDIFHYYSMTRMLIAFMFFLIFTFDFKEMFNIANGIWLILGPVAGYLFARGHLAEEQTGELYRLYGWLIAAGGFVVINIIYTIVKAVRKKLSIASINLWFAVPFAVFAIGISILANTRYWVWILVGMCVLIMYRLLVRNNSNDFLNEMCLGIILNFYMMVWFSLNHRPYYFYQFYRYNMGYHTVTVTAYYLTLIVCAALVRLYVKTGKNKSIGKLLPQLFTLGMSCAFLLFTMSRTGMLSTAVTVIFVLIAVTLFTDKKEKRIAATVKRCGVLFLTVIYMFPVTYSLVDICPRIANDPITFEFEYRDFTFEKGMPYSDINYMTIEQFVKEFGKKVLNMNPDDKKAYNRVIHNPLVLPVYAAEEAPEAEQEEVDVTDMSNGRFDIFKSYIAVWNAWGHDEMGALLPNGEIAVHAHNTFLQVIHDHGLVFGIYFVIFMLYVFILGVRYACKEKDNGIMLLFPTILTGFAVAGLVEWILHVCNPFGLAVFMCMMPLVIKQKGYKDEKSN